MYKKLNIVSVSLFFVTFVGVFWSSYKNSGKFRQSIQIAFVWALINLSPISAEAKGSWGADAFTPAPIQRNVNPKNSGLFGQQKSQPNSAPGSPGGGSGSGDDFNSNSEPECIENSKPANMYDDRRYWHSEETSSTETESDSYEDSDWEEEFLRSMNVTASDGNQVILEHDQFQDKAYHLDVFPRIEIPKTFDIEYAKTLDYKSRLEYVRDRKNLPNKTVWEMQWEANKFFRSTKTEAFPGTLGKNHIKGTVYINEQTRTVAFVNKYDRKCRTMITMSDNQLQRLENRNYHLFPKR